MSANQSPSPLTAILPHAPGNSGPQPGGGVGVTALDGDDPEATIAAIGDLTVGLLSDADEPKPEGRGRAALVRDAYDEATYAHAKGDYARLHSAELAGGEKLSTSGDLLRDVYASFHQRQPIPVDPESLTAAHRVNHELVSELMATEQHAELRNGGTVGDDLNAAIATIASADALIARLTDAERDQLNELADAEAQADSLDALGDALAEQAATTGDQSWNVRANGARQRAAQQRARASALERQLRNHGAARRDAARRAGRKAMETAKQEIQSLNTASEAFGGPGSGAGDGLSQMPLKDKLALAKKLRGSNKLARLAELVGRLRSLASALQNAKVQHSPSEIADITLGADLPYVLPEEIGLLGDADLELAFIAAYAEETLLQYHLHGEDKIGKGPIIVACDESGSMTASMASDHGASVTRELWSKAVALALLAVARQQRRDFALIHFSGGPCRVDVFPKGQATPNQLIDSAEHFYNGGTEYEGWMAEALKLIDKSRFDKADVVLISDGEAHVGDDTELAWESAQRRRHFRTYGIMIGHQGSAGYGEYGLDTLRKICDAVIPIQALGNERAALNAILSV